VRACVEAGIATGEVVHIDATLIRANVSWDSIAERHITAVIEENRDNSQPAVQTSEKRTSSTDPDASLATSDRRMRAQPCYKQHTTVDDTAGIVMDVTITSGDINEGDLVEQQLLSAVSGSPVDVRGSSLRTRDTPTRRYSGSQKALVWMRLSRQKRSQNPEPQFPYVGSSTTQNIRLSDAPRARYSAGQRGRHTVGTTARPPIPAAIAHYENYVTVPPSIPAAS
jgi:hypothetical protein